MMGTVLLVLLIMQWLDQPPLSAEKKPELQYSLLRKEWKIEIEELKERPTLTEVERQQQRRAINTRYTTRFRQLAEENVADEREWVFCLIWMSAEGVPGPDLDAMFDFLGENAHRLSKETSQLQLQMSYFISLQSERINSALEKIANGHRDAHLRGAALFVLAARTKRSAEKAGDPEGCQKAALLLERVLAEYPDCHTYHGKNSENAQELLDELRSPVALTRPVLESRGKTISGEDFDLRETIRGKVAVLSFSGHWCSPCVAMHPVQKEMLSR